MFLRILVLYFVPLLTHVRNFACLSVLMLSLVVSVLSILACLVKRRRQIHLKASAAPVKDTEKEH